MESTWDPTQYLRYADQRERPFWDLVGRVPTADVHRAVDLGCGPGTTTVGLLDRWPGAGVVGLDSSPEMIGRAAALASARLNFELADLTRWEPEPASLDVIVSNATLQWVPGHLELFPRWLRALRPGGTLAFQVPGNFGAPSHTLLYDLAGSPAWRDRLAGVVERPGSPEPAEYLRRLLDLGVAADVWETTYHQTLTGADPVLEWVRGSALRPILEVLDEAETAAFTATYGEALRAAYPADDTGRTVFPFRRIFVVATVA
jgi:trans-aconitate 2-methyltransferase